MYLQKEMQTEYTSKHIAEKTSYDACEKDCTLGN